MKASDFPRHHMGDNRRFHARPANGKHEVYGADLQHVCECDTSEMADMVADALEFQADNDIGAVPLRRLGT